MSICIHIREYEYSSYRHSDWGGGGGVRLGAVHKIRHVCIKYTSVWDNVTTGGGEGSIMVKNSVT